MLDVTSEADRAHHQAAVALRVAESLADACCGLVRLELNGVVGAADTRYALRAHAEWVRALARRLSIQAGTIETRDEG